MIPTPHADYFKIRSESSILLVTLRACFNHNFQSEEIKISQGANEISKSKQPIATIVM